VPPARDVFSLAPGPHPQRELTLMPRRGFTVGGSAWPQALLWLSAFAVYAALTLVFTWPIARYLSSGFANDAFDPALTTWILWWNAHAVPLTSRWLNAPMFWPITGSFTLSEHLLGISVLATPMQWLGSSPLTAINVAVLLSFPLCAIAAHALAFAITRRHDAAIIAALVFGFSPYRVSHLSHVQILWSFGLPLALVAAHRYVATHRAGWLVLFGASWLMAALSNGYFMLFFPVLLACWVLWFCRDRFDWLPLVAAWLIASIPLLPVMWLYERVHTRMGLARPLPEIVRYSADVTAIFAASPHMILWHALSKWARPEGELFPGALALLLAAAGVVSAIRDACRIHHPSGAWARTAKIGFAAGAAVAMSAAIGAAVFGPWRIGSMLSVSSAPKPLTIALMLAVLATVTTRPAAAAWQRRSTLAFYSAAAALMFVFCLGPFPTFAGRRILFRAPYAWLLALPGYSSIRVPARFGLLFVLALAIAGACALAHLTEKLQLRTRRILAALAALTIVAESWPAPAIAEAPPPIAALRRADPIAPLVELPLGLVHRDTAALFRSMDHGRPIINGYSGFAPAHYVILEIALRDDDVGALAALGEGAPITVAIDRRFQFERWTSALAARHAALVAIDGDEYLYRLDAALADHAPAGERLPIDSVGASVAADRVPQMLDGDWWTAWSTPGPQQGTENVVVDLGRERYVAVVRMDFGPLAGDVPRSLAIDCSGSDGGWQTCWQGSAPIAALRGALQDPRVIPAIFPIDRARVRRLRLRETKPDTDRAWSIAELAVLGR
jgi:hypothetical protein